MMEAQNLNIQSLPLCLSHRFFMLFKHMVKEDAEVIR